MDSDEEDNEESSTKYDVMTEDDVEGQEEETVDYDDGEKITPFNMKEEMEEGHFDKQGNYFFKKDAEIKVGSLRRLAHLLTKAPNLQVDLCVWFYTVSSSKSLLEIYVVSLHRDRRNQFPIVGAFIYEIVIGFSA